MAERLTKSITAVGVGEGLKGYEGLFRDRRNSRLEQITGRGGLDAADVRDERRTDREEEE